MFDFIPTEQGRLLAEDPADLGADALLETVQLFERVIRWATAGQLAALAAFARFRPGVDRDVRGADTHLPGGGFSEFAADEVASLLGVSRYNADGRLSLAWQLAERLPATMAALRAGAVDVSKARVLAEGTAQLDARAAGDVEAAVLPQAGRRTPGQLRARVARAALAVDPAGAAQRHAAVRRQRRFIVTAVPDGMSELWMLAPADQLQRAISRVREVAERAATKGDDRSVDERRVDTLLDLLIDSATGDPVDVTGATTSKAPPSMAPPSTSPPSHLRSRAADDRSRPQILVTVAATTLWGLDDKPGDLAGHGPIPADMARALAADGTWRRLLTDPRSGSMVELGRDRYAPGVALAEHVRTRDRTCRFPGCRQPARRCDLDHSLAFPRGHTCRDNLAALCRHHHRLKHETAWEVRQAPGGSGALTWTSPTGRVYRTSPDPFVEDLPGAGARGAATDAGATSTTQRADDVVAA